MPPDEQNKSIKNINFEKNALRFLESNNIHNTSYELHVICDE
jgi:hypothetical protein